MEASAGVVSRAIPCIPRCVGAGSRLARPIVGVPWNSGRVSMGSGFRDDGHVKFYSLAMKCGHDGGKVGKLAEKAAKKKLKLAKGLYKELSMFTQIGFGACEGIDTVDEQAKRVSEAAEVLLAQLKQLKAEEKEMKRRRKQEKARLKAERMNCAMESESSSSDMSDGEDREVFTMSRLRTQFPAQNSTEQTPPITQGLVVPVLPSTNPLDSIDIPTTSTNVSTAEPVDKKIEVCMGGKCKKAGGAALLEELQKTVGIEGAVVGCKCMGKCRDGPNVRVCNDGQSRSKGVGEDSGRVTPTLNPLCIGVGLEDVDVIVSKFFGTEENDLDLRLSPAA